MTYTNNECPVCHRKFTDDDDIVVCPDCGTPHHRACWQSLGACANRAYHNTDFAWTNTAAPEDTDSKRETAAGRTRSRSVECPNCGGMNSEGSDRCEFCGANLGYRTRRPSPNGSALDNDLIPPNIAIDGIPAQEEAQYIGPGATRYIYRFLEMDRRDSKTSWNWGAVIFGPFWCFYRKMYGVGLIYIVLSLIIAILCTPAGLSEFIRNLGALIAQTQDYETIIAYISDNMPMFSGWQEMLFSGFRTVSSVLLGLFGNYLYRRKVQTSILNIRPKADSMDAYMFMLSKKGGVSILFPILLAFYFIYVQSFIMLGFASLFSR